MQGYTLQAPMYPRNNYGYGVLKQKTYNQRQITKRSGARMGTMNDGKIWFSGWKRTKQGFLSAIATVFAPTKSPRWHKAVCNITNKTTGMVTTVSGLYDEQKQRIRLNNGLIISPKSPNGGYFGKGGYKMQIRNRR